jgi:lysozyme family protein
MRGTYDEAIARVFADEGRLQQPSIRSRRPTNWGITIADARLYWKTDASAADVRAMPKSVASEIYSTKYAAAVRYDELPAGLDYALLDYAIHSGIGRAGKVLRRWLGLPDDNAHVTDAVLAAVRARDARVGVVWICDERLAFLKRLKTWPVFGAGWGRRVAGVRATALQMARGQPADAFVVSTSSSGKGVVPVNSAAQKGTVGGIATAGAAAAQQAHQSSARPIVIVTIVLLVAALAVAGWFAWRWRQRHLQEA